MKPRAPVNLPPAAREVYDFCLRTANFNDHGAVKRGQLLVSYADIQDGLHWYVGWAKRKYSVSQIESATKTLRKAGLIATRKTTRGFIITVCDYNKIQNPKTYENRRENHGENHGENRPIRESRNEKTNGNHRDRFARELFEGYL